ncbi:MAG: DUF63 family protein [Candidatus Aenigmatarchaeota archaeon]
MLKLVEKILRFLFLPQPQYTLINTCIYAISFVFVSYFFFLFLQKMKIKVNRDLAISILPFIFLGSGLRVFVDYKLFESILLTTPLIYLTIGFIFVLAVIFSKFLQKRYKIPYFKTTSFLGVLLASPFVVTLIFKIVNPLALIFVLILLLPWLVLMKIIKWEDSNKAAFLSQIFDATVSFVGINFFDYEEMHVLPKIFIQSLGPISFLFLKAIVIFSILILLEKLKGEEEIKNFIKLMIGILGASTGIRDLLRILVLT